MALEQFAPSPLSHFDPADLLDVLSTGVVVLDGHLCVVYANVGAQDLLGQRIPMRHDVEVVPPIGQSNLRF